VVESRVIPWKRIAIEAVAIVVSILLAFAIDAWWSDRQRSNEEKSILASLYPEAQELVRLVNYIRTYTDGLRDATRRTYDASAASNTEITDAEIDQFLIEIGWHIEPSNANAPVLESLVKGGELVVVSSGELRRHMGSTMVLIDGYREEIIRDSDFYNSTLLPFLQTHAALGQVYSLESHEPGFPERIYPSYNLAPGQKKTSNREVFESRNFQNLLLHRITTTTNILDWQESYLEPQLKTLVDLIEKELGIEPDD
jgi:hypothetical protein